MDIGNLYRRAESARQLDGPSIGIQRRILGAVDRTPTTRKIADALRGSLVGHPLHPALVTVPAGAWTASVIFDFFVREPETARRLIALGLITTPPVLLTGWLDWSERSDTARRVGLVHAAANGVGIMSFIASYRLRACETGGLRSARLLSLIGLTAVSVGGALGGHIVFRLMDASTSV
ncbi:DUF2231 domain-containing protein [Rhodococcus sp. ARC_M6]|uniref:DUF2231 domain-containing protein n=1 Tax=Rhodococcus sp. ARC_M6 TaxID=2928852 RepID=UPI001FB367D6|nr:DUF2231 domain-containing protein [Rhodococcus sp. ARC_M6]MCJ0902344.1 hypothetical protein [Rhodococcus sp. ARC_M6]